jgi:hypothetical protein
MGGYFSGSKITACGDAGQQFCAEGGTFKEI